MTTAPGSASTGTAARQLSSDGRTRTGFKARAVTFAPPAWLVDQFATAPRATRVLANLIDKAGRRFPLPEGAQSVNVPRLTTGNAEAGTADDSVDPETDVVDANATSPAASISGRADVALQLLEQSPPGAHLDVCFFQDLTEAYDAQLEAMLFSGSGPNTQPTTSFTGLLNLSGTNSVTYTDASPTATAMYPYLGQAIAKIGDNRKRSDGVTWLMTTSRAAWIGSQEDTSHRPLALTDAGPSGAFNILTYWVSKSDAISTTLGTGGNQDAILAVRPADMMLWESSPFLQIGTEVLSGTLQARLVLRGYAAFVVRQPTAVSIVSGTGTITQAGY